MTPTTKHVDSSQLSPTWWAHETAIRFSDLPNYLPRKADGSKISLASAYRYGLNGVHGVRLRRFRAAGNAWATTLEELARWQRRLTQDAGGDA